MEICIYIYMNIIYLYENSKSVERGGIIIDKTENSDEARIEWFLCAKVCKNGRIGSAPIFGVDVIFLCEIRITLRRVVEMIKCLCVIIFLQIWWTRAFVDDDAAWCLFVEEGEPRDFVRRWWWNSLKQQQKKKKKNERVELEGKCSWCIHGFDLCLNSQDFDPNIFCIYSL